MDGLTYTILLSIKTHNRIELMSYLYGSKYDITYLIDMPNQKYNFQSGLQSESS